MVDQDEHLEPKHTIHVLKRGPGICLYKTCLPWHSLQISELREARVAIRRKHTSLTTLLLSQLQRTMYLRHEQDEIGEENNAQER